MNHIIQQIEAERATRKVPEFKPGDTIIVNVKVTEGDRERVQAYEGVERVFQLYSPSIADIVVKRRGNVRRAKLYYLRDRSGKSARIREKLAHVRREKQGE